MEMIWRQKHKDEAKHGAKAEKKNVQQEKETHT